MSVSESFLSGLDNILAWIGSTMSQSTEEFVFLETADSRETLACKDGSLVSIIQLHGATQLVGPEEFDKIHQGLSSCFGPPMSRLGHAIQVYFEYDREAAREDIQSALAPAFATAKRLKLSLDDLFDERISHLSKYCAAEACYFVLITRPNTLTETQMKMATQNRLERIREANLPPSKQAQNVIAGIPELRETHDSFVQSVLNELQDLHLHARLLEVHDALHRVRRSVDPDATDSSWRPVLPGDKIPMRNLRDPNQRDLSELLWPPLTNQLVPRDGEVMDMRTSRIGDRIFASMYVDLFPQDIKSFFDLFKRCISSKIPWRCSFLIESDGIKTMGMKPMLASILSFASAQNNLIADAAELLNYYNDNTDTAIVKLRLDFTTWAPANKERLLRTRAAELLKAIQGWGQCEVAEISGDSYSAALASALALNLDSPASASIAPLDDVCYMLPFSRPASPWNDGAVLFRSPDGKVWPFQPGSTQQTTWIDLVYARPGSGKSVLSNSINLALCLQGGLQRLPRIAIIDIGPSSSGLISLLKESLPEQDRHLVAYHRLRMTPDYAINPFDTQLGCRKPLPQERSFLVNFITLLATPVGESKAYDGISDMAGLIVDELYKTLSDEHNPRKYTPGVEPDIDAIVTDTLKLHVDAHTTWWEVTDALYNANKIHHAIRAQRYTVPLLADAVAICRTPVIEDLYGKIVAPTGEPLIAAFGRMISSAVREYPLLSRVTAFDIGDARVISLDLDEVAKTGGDAADRQTAVMYMLARYVMARHFYLTEENVEDFPGLYRNYHRERIREIREDQKRIVFDEFHRTSTAKAVRDQVIVDMREGRKWKVQVALLSQSLDDFDSVMVEFATAIYIMDAGPKQAIDKSVNTFGLSETARLALATRVHGPRAEGATFLVQYATKLGINIQLCTSTLGPIELWAFNTTAEDATIRNTLYKRIGARETRKLLAMLYPSGSAAKVVEQRLAQLKVEDEHEISDEEKKGVVAGLIEEIMQVYEGTHGSGGKTNQTAF